jgi:glycerophosphoryl diester phosphodiesterase
MPGVAGRPAPRVWAHRGARRRAPENTLPAFTLALALGADGVELDARRTADDMVVVHHDPSTRRLGVLAHASFARLRAVRPEVPTLDEALDACAGALVNVELKNLPGEPGYDPEGRIADLVAARLAARGERDDVLVSSFNLDVLDRYHRVDAARPTGLLTLRGFDPRHGLRLVADRGHRALHPDVRGFSRVAAPLVERAHELALGVHVWTVNDAARIRRLAAAGVDALITDVPEVALDALGR